MDLAVAWVVSVHITLHCVTHKPTLCAHPLSHIHMHAGDTGGLMVLGGGHTGVAISLTQIYLPFLIQSSPTNVYRGGAQDIPGGVGFGRGGGDVAAPGH